MNVKNYNLPCRHCGKSKEDHLACTEYEAITLPKGCVCDLRDWNDINNMPLVCEEFKPLDGDKEVCLICEHEKNCHKEYKYDQ